MTRSRGIAFILPIGAALMLSGCSFMTFLFGSAMFKLRFDSAQQSAGKSTPSFTGSFYDSAVFGRYITSITPSRFVIPINNVTFYSSDSSRSQICVVDAGKYIETHDASLYLGDFTDPQKVNQYAPEIIPGASNFDYLVVSFKFSPNKFGIYTGTGTPTPDSWNDPTQTTIFYDEPSIVLPLPSGYTGVTLDIENTDRVRDGLNLNCRNIETLVENALGIPAATTGDPPTVVSTMIFGNANAAYSLLIPPPGSAIGQNIGLKQDIMWYGPGYTAPIIRGPLPPLDLPLIYSAITVSVHFDIAGIVQIYEGPDALPYTADDVFVLAPEFYKRLGVDCAID